MTLAFDHLMNKTAESRKLNSLHCCNKHVEIKDNSLCLLHFVNVIKEKSVNHLTYKMVIIFFRIRPPSLYRKEIILRQFFCVCVHFIPIYFSSSALSTRPSCSTIHVHCCIHHNFEIIIACLSH